MKGLLCASQCYSIKRGIGYGLWLDIQGELQSHYELEKLIMGREILPI